MAHYVGCHLSSVGRAPAL